MLSAECKYSPGLYCHVSASFNSKMCSKNQGSYVKSWRDLPPPDATIAPRLLRWFKLHGRPFPWRETTTPYHLLVAEIMLQRTRAAQVVPVFLNFTRTYPKPANFVRRGPGAAREVFQSLGLLWRADQFWNLHRVLLEKYGGVIPRDPAELHSLPGVGDYVAAALRVFAFGEILTILDSNVLRILGRYFGISFPDHARRSGRVQAWATQLAPNDPGDCRPFNWALIDHGASICLATRPRLIECPILQGCIFAVKAGQDRR